MLANNGNTRETSISTPAMGHDRAWRKAAMVTIIAVMLPRSMRGLDDIASTTGIVEKSILLAENGIVTGRAQEEGYAVLLRAARFRGIHPLQSERTKTQPLLFCQHPSVPNAPEPNDSNNSLVSKRRRRPFGASYPLSEPNRFLACFKVQYRARKDRAIAGNRTRLTRISIEPTVMPMEVPVD